MYRFFEKGTCIRGIVLIQLVLEQCPFSVVQKGADMAGKGQKRKDKDRIVLRTGEGQRPNGTYEYRWTDATGKRRRVYAKTLEELREKEHQIEKDNCDGIKAEARYVTLNDFKENESIRSQ